MKTWFYLEGVSEKPFIEWLMRTSFPNITIQNDLSVFLKPELIKVCYITNCNSGDKIPYTINEEYHLIQRSQTKNIVIICDVETELHCPTERKEKILRKIEKTVDKSLLKFIFSIPLLEEIYCFEKDITKNVLKKLYKQKYNKDIIPNMASFENNRNPLCKIMSFFKQNELTYKKTEFAENFFPQLNYQESSNNTVKRLFNVTTSIFQN